MGSPREGSSEEDMDHALLFRREKGDISAKASSSSSSHISSDSVIPFLRRRVMLNRSLFFVVGVRGALGEEMRRELRWLWKGDALPLARFASSSPCKMRVLLPASESLSSPTKPMPGVSVFWETEGLVAGSLLRRQERARTPTRRISVPRAICGLVNDPEIQNWGLDSESLPEERGVKRVVMIGQSKSGRLR